MVTAVVLIALVVCLVGSLVIGRNIRLVHYASNRSSSSFWQVFFTIMGSLVGGWMFFGLCAIGYQAGIVGYIIGVGYGIGLFILAFFIPKIKEMMVALNCDTMDDLIGAKYGVNVQKIVTGINLAFFLAVLAAQFIALSAFLRVFGNIEASWLFYVASIVLILYTAFAGYRGVLLTDMWQFFILSISALSIFIVLANNIPMDAIKALDVKYFTGTAFGPVFLIGILFLFPPSMLVRTDLWQRVASARDAKNARKAFLWAIPILLVFYFVLTSVGIYGRAGLGPNVVPESSGFVLFLSVLADGGFGGSLIAQILLSILSLGIFAALLSTADTNLNIIAIALSKLFYREKWKSFEQDTSNKTGADRSLGELDILNRTRYITAGLGVVAIAIAWAVPDIVDLIVSAASSIMVFLPAVLYIILNKEASGKAAFISILLGFIVLAVMLFVSPKTAFLPAAVVSAIAFFVSNIIWKSPSLRSPAKGAKL